MPTFTPPTYTQRVATRERVVNLLATVTKCYAVVRINGSLTAVTVPSSEQLTAAGEEGTDWFIGGSTYTVSSATATELTNAGFTVTD